MTICELCGEPVNTTKKSVLVKVEGWLPRNMAGGGQIRLRALVDPPAFAHEVCVRYAMKNIPVGHDQPALF